MKAFLMSIVALVVISAVASIGLNAFEMSAKGTYQAPSSVRY